MKAGTTVLIVDDERNFCTALMRELRGLGYDGLAAGSVQEAQAAVTGEPPCLIILGTVMPRGDTYRFHLWLKQNPRFQGIPHVIVDAPPEKRLSRGWRKEEGMRLEAEEYFGRPIKPAALAFAVQKILDVQERKFRILVADDHAMVREGIRALLNLQRDIQIVGEAMDGEDAVAKARELLPDIILMDIIMPGMNGIEAARRISREGLENTRILMLSQYDDEENIMASRKAGAVGFVSKKSVSSCLLEAIRDTGQSGQPRQYFC